MPRPYDPGLAGRRAGLALPGCRSGSPSFVRRATARPDMSRVIAIEQLTPDGVIQAPGTGPLEVD